MAGRELQMRMIVGLLILVCVGFWSETLHAENALRSFATQHTTVVDGRKLPYSATVEEFIINDKAGAPALSLFATTYFRDHVSKLDDRPVVFMFNGGPSAAALGLHLQFGPERDARGDSPPSGATRFEANSYSLLDVADLVVFDPAETGFSRLLNEADRPYFYSTEGDCDSLAQLVIAWRQRHQRAESPLYLLGESYGSIRQVVTGSLLAKKGVSLAGQIILGDSIFLQETSRRTHNIVSSAVSLPLLAMTAAYHGKADKKGKSDADFLNEVYDFAMNDYLLALSKGYTIRESDKQAIAQRLAAYTGIPAEYYLTHGLTIAKQDFNRELLQGQMLNANDTRIASPLEPPPKNEAEAEKQQIGNMLDPLRRIYTDYFLNELKVNLPGLDYRLMAPHSFEQWDWGNGCNKYLLSAGLCNPDSPHPSVFTDYDWPETLKSQFADPKFRVMIVAGYYDGLSSIGTHRYLAAQLGYPADRFSIHEYAAGHATAGDPVAQPQVARDIRSFIGLKH
jgi:carboxypeptidase C (cathepsin A)